MIAYYEPYKIFKYHVENNQLVNQILDNLGQNVSPSEERSWRNSLKEMYKVLLFSDLHDEVEIGIEYRLPISSKRIDILISGSDENNDNIIIIELKQWSEIKKTDMPGLVEMQGRFYTHPSWQAYSYAKTISFFNEAVEKNNISFYPAAFLHNYKKQFLDELIDPIYSDAIKEAPVFIEADYKKLTDFIDKYIKVPSKKSLLYEIDKGKIRPSKMLIEVLGNMLNGNEEFTLIDEQKIVSEYIYKRITKQSLSSKKQVIVVEGGAGTGKTLIAIDLMGRLITKKSKNVLFVSKSSYLRENFFKKLTKGIPQYVYLKSLFKGSGSFISTKPNEFDGLIVDEAHRLMEQTKRSWMFNGVDQVKEIINAANVSVFFIDQKQHIDIKDHGTIETIKKWANFYDADLHLSDDLKLKSQFRCNGSDSYIQWVDSILYNEPFEKTEDLVDYDIQIFNKLSDMKLALEKKNDNNKSRLISGDVFPWVSRSDPDKIDIVLDGFQAQWNRTSTFATDPKSFDEVGCIHTTQGMEFEYVGLIIADDLIYSNGKVTTDYTKHPSGANEFKRPFKRSVDPADESIIDNLIRNTYRVLLSRGQKGVFIYCMNKNLETYLINRLEDLSLSEATNI